MMCITCDTFSYILRFACKSYLNLIVVKTGKNMIVELPD
jgi:hypothetical protein